MNVAVNILALALATALLVRFRIRVTRQWNRWRCEVRCGRFTLIDTARRAGYRRRRPNREGVVKPWKRFPVARFIELAPDLMRAAGRGLRFLLRRIRLDCIRISGTLEGSDPAETGIACGLIVGLVALIETRTPAAHVAVNPGFMGEGTHVWIEGEASVQIATLVALPFIIFFLLPKKALVQFAIENLRRQSWSSKTS